MTRDERPEGRPNLNGDFNSMADPAWFVEDGFPVAVPYDPVDAAFVIMRTLGDLDIAKAWADRFTTVVDAFAEVGLDPNAMVAERFARYALDEAERFTAMSDRLDREHRKGER